MGEKAKENESKNTEKKMLLSMPSRAAAAPKDDEDLGEILAAIEAKKKLSKGRGAEISKEVNIDDRNPFLKKAVEQGKNEDEEDRGEILTNAGAKKKVATGWTPSPGFPFSFNLPLLGWRSNNKKPKKWQCLAKYAKMV